MMHVRKLASLAMAVGLALPAGAAFANEPSSDLPDGALDVVAPPIPVAQPAAPEKRPAQEQVAQEMSEQSAIVGQYIEADDDGTLDFNEDRARADGVAPELIAAAEGVEDRLDDAEDGVVTPASGDAEGVPLTFEYSDQCVPEFNGKPITQYTPSIKIDDHGATCKPQVEGSSSRRIEKNPVINGIAYNGYYMTTTQRYKATAVCAFYSWSITHERTEEVWVLTDYLGHQTNTHPVLELDT